MAGTTGNQEIARRYAVAFFELVQAGDAIESIASDMAVLAELVAAGGDFTTFLHNATLRRADQGRALVEIAKHLKLSPLTEKLLGTLAARRRLPALAETVAAVQALIAAHKGEVTAQVVAAQALDQNQITEIAASLKKALGMTVRVNLDVDPAIMGGLIIKVGSKLMDSSVRTKLERLHRALKQSSQLSDKAKMREVA